MGAELCVFVPSNNTDKRGNPRPLDGNNELVRQARTGAYVANARKIANERHVAGGRVAAA